MPDRITHHKILGDIDYVRVPFKWNGSVLYGIEGESLTAALLANDIRTLRRHEKDGSPRGMYCNIGHCSECRIIINGRKNQRACLTPLRKDMETAIQAEVPYIVTGDDHHV